jgi:hypothetical protein
MTTTDAVFLTTTYLRALDLNGWKVKVVERFTSEKLSHLIGYCEVTDKTIWLTKAAIERSDALATATIQHEVAHCLQPAAQFYDESAAHGADFEKALERVRKMNIEPPDEPPLKMFSACRKYANALNAERLAAARAERPSRGFVPKEVWKAHLSASQKETWARKKTEQTAT